VAFGPEGRPLWRLDFKANINTSGLSHDGTLAFVSTCTSEHPPHSDKTLLLDASSGRVLWIHDGRPDARFAGNTLVADVRLRTGGTFTYPFNALGKLPPEYDAKVKMMLAEARREYEREGLEFGKHWIILPRVRSLLRETPPNVDEARRLLAKLAGKENRILPESRALMRRYDGEIAAAEGELARAVDLWRVALELDPEVGVRRRLEETRALLKKRA